MLLTIFILSVFCYNSAQSQSCAASLSYQRVPVQGLNWTQYCTDEVVKNSTYQRDICCSNKVQHFRYRWYSGGNYITTYLGTLKAWKCPEFEMECKKPTYAFNDYTTTVYLMLCNKTMYDNQCDDSKRLLYEKLNISNLQGGFPLLEADLSELSRDDLNDPCVQTTLFDNFKSGRFVEVVQFQVPFSSGVWAGLDVKTAQKIQVNPWFYFSNRVKGSIIVCVLILSLLAIGITIANATVIAIFIINPKLRNSQYHYKLGLAIADFLVGAVVIPCSIQNQFITYLAYRGEGPTVQKDYFNTGYTNETFHGDLNLTLHEQGGGLGHVTNQPYVSFVGFMNTTMLFVSVYTLAVATFDRFMAIFKPLRYNKFDAIKKAKILTLVVWIVALLLGSLPLFVNQMKYGIAASIFATPTGFGGLMLLSIAFILPLVVVWMLTYLTFKTSIKHTKVRHRLQGQNHDKLAVEVRLARTMSLMVGAFSVCVIPVIVALIVPMATNNLTFANPCTLNIDSATGFGSFEYCVIIVLLSNSLWNVFIYSARNERFRTSGNLMYKQMFYKMRFHVIIEATRRLAANARKASLIPFEALRRPSSESGGDRKRSVSSLLTEGTQIQDEKKKSVDSMIMMHTISSGENTGHTSKSGRTNLFESVEVPDRDNKYKRRAKKKNEDANEDSTFGSFAIDAGADRLFESVMEKIETTKKQSNE